MSAGEPHSTKGSCGRVLDRRDLCSEPLRRSRAEAPVAPERLSFGGRMVATPLAVV